MPSYGPFLLVFKGCHWMAIVKAQWQEEKNFNIYERMNLSGCSADSVMTPVREDSEGRAWGGFASTWFASSNSSIRGLPSQVLQSFCIFMSWKKPVISFQSIKFSDEMITLNCSPECHLCAFQKDYPVIALYEAVSPSKPKKVANIHFLQCTQLTDLECT